MMGCAGVPRGAEGPPPTLPSNFRQTIAVSMAAAFLHDGTGPAEIQPEPVRRVTLFEGEQTLLFARYPVRRVDFLGRNMPGMRCFTISTPWKSGDGKIEITVRSEKRDPQECLVNTALVPFTELNEMRRRAEDCKARGQKTCILSTTFSGGEAELLRRIERLQAPPLPRGNPFR